MHIAQGEDGNYFISDGKGQIDDPQSAKWYHGSPVLMDTLSAGSSITRNRDLAVAFSHKPSQLCVSDEGVISHNGQGPGYLYEVDEPISADDIFMHGACEERDPWEWVTRRPLRLRLICETKA